LLKRDLLLEVVQKRAPTVRWRSVALPTEHGGWAFVIEPLLLGLILAPGLAGLSLSIGALAAFLLRQPLKIYIKDVRNQRLVPRTYAARRFMLLYGSITAIAGIATLLLIPSLDALLPLLFALPLFALQFTYDIRNQSRSVIAEIAGTLATGALASSIVMMHGWSLLPALGLWVVLAAKAVTAVLYVRSRLRLEREKSTSVGLALGAHAGAVILVLVTTASALTRWTALLAIVILSIRAAVGLSAFRKVRPPKIIGMQEIAYSLIFLLLVALGYK
jgi:hypothetical protein